MPYSGVHPVDTPLLVATVRDSDEVAGNAVMFGAHHVTRKRYATCCVWFGFWHQTRICVFVRRWVATSAVTSYCVGREWQDRLTARLSNYWTHRNYYIIIKIMWRGRALRSWAWMLSGAFLYRQFHKIYLKSEFFPRNGKPSSVLIWRS
jgi:hypothetical protein